MSLVARALEAAGIATVVTGSALDIVRHCKVPRYLFTDFPLGNPCGKPYDEASQRDIIDRALDLLATARAAPAIAHCPQTWSGDSDWKRNYMYVGPENRDQLAREGEARRAAQAATRDRVASGQTA